MSSCKEKDECNKVIFDKRTNKITDHTLKI